MFLANFLLVTGDFHNNFGDVFVSDSAAFSVGLTVTETIGQTVTEAAVSKLTSD